MPYEWIYRLFGQKDPLNIIWITLGAVPIFLHQISASSILYHIKSSLHGTLDGGAALAFMIGGPVTAVPTMVMFWTIFKKRVFFLYLFICIAGTILISYAFQFFVFVPYADTGNPLLKDVAAISGGSSAVILKQDERVRIVMDPGGKSIIATCTDDIQGQGGVVFDGSLLRFLNSSSDRYDNLRYISNVARWLEQNNTSQAKKSILIYDAFSGPGQAKDVFSSNAVSVLKKKGFRVRLTGRGETPEITDGLLGGYGQVWMLFRGATPESRLSDTELETISRFTGDGGSMLIAAGNNESGSADLLAASRLSSRYGVLFSGSVENEGEIPASSASYLLNRASIVLGKILKIVHKA
jgi:hypothetical protein